MSEETVKEAPDIPNWQKYLNSVIDMANQGVNSLPLAVFVYLETLIYDSRLKFRFVWRGRR